MAFQGAGKQTETTPPGRRGNSSSAPSNEELSLYSLLQVIRPLPVFHDGDQTGRVDFPSRQYQYQYQHEHQEEEVQPASEPRMFRRMQSSSRTPSSRSIICELIDVTLELVHDGTDLLFSIEANAATTEEERDDLQE